jgi:crotonobetainyl-CoA:carnitine CoA-transferase CaiB-like acyl-CoA transferase
VLRSQSVNELYALIAEVAPTRTTDAWLAALRAADIPCARVNAVGDLLHDPHLAATGFFHEYDHPTEGRLRGHRPPFRWQDHADLPDRPAPRPGGDSRELLQQAGFSDPDIDRLITDGVVRVDTATTEAA